jgi:hypothetical protein
MSPGECVRSIRIRGGQRLEIKVGERGVGRVGLCCLLLCVCYCFPPSSCQTSGRSGFLRLNIDCRISPMCMVWVGVCVCVCVVVCRLHSFSFQLGSFIDRLLWSTWCQSEYEDIILVYLYICWDGVGCNIHSRRVRFLISSFSVQCQPKKQGKKACLESSTM